MKSILIVNLRRLGDVYTTSHLINSLTSSGECHVSLLVYKESEAAASTIKNITNVHTIDRKEIITLKSNKLFSDGYALEHLFNQIQDVHAQEWDSIINFSNDLVGTYLCSYLQERSKKIIGVHFNQNRIIQAQPDWELLYNSVLPELEHSPIHFVDCLHKMAGVSLNREGEKLKTNTSFNEIAFKNLSSLRSSAKEATSDVKIVGIQLTTSDAEKNPSESTMHQLINELLDSKNYVPVILIAPTEQERKMAEEFNRSHDNEVVVVEADLTALTSVLMNIDLLVTPDTAVKHMADLTETPVIELSIGYAPFLKQGTYSKDSLILTNVITDRVFKKNKSQPEARFTARDILTSIKIALGQTPTTESLTKGVTLYRSNFDELGVSYSPICGSVDKVAEVSRHANRQLIYSMFERSDEKISSDSLKEYNSSETQAWVAGQKDAVTEVMKDLLGTLRTLLQTVENKKSSRDFIQNLGKLISHSETVSITQIPVSMFKGKIESINTKSFHENAKEVEILLYELKADIQKVLFCLKEVESAFNSSKMDTMVSRAQESLKA